MTTPLIAEAEAFLNANPDVKFIYLLLTDLNGIARGKMVRRHELMPIYRNGRALPSSILSLDTLGDDVNGTGLVWDVADRDCKAVPVPGSLKRCPWEADSAQVLLTLCDSGGLPLATGADPRNVLKRVIGKFSGLGMTPVLACELEFYLLDKAAWQKGEVRPATTGEGFPLDRTNVYRVQDLEDLGPFLRDLYAMCDAQGIPAETAISEYAPGQVELTLTHRADALQAVDEAIQYKRIVKAAAMRHGMVATFMAKPFTSQSGSGMHMHASLAGDAGTNLFTADGIREGGLLRSAIGGLATTMADAMLIFAPNANSYRRFRLNSYAPVGTNWGVNNRTVSLRVPEDGVPSIHLEHRVSGADANPYLVAAAMLAGMHKGITEKLDAGEPVTGNGYEGPRASLPTNWHAALEAFSGSAFIRDYMGDAFAQVFHALKAEECDRFYGEVTAQDHAWLLRGA